MKRENFVNLSVIGMFSLLLLGIANLNIVHAKKYKDLSDRSCIRMLPKAGARGKIIDRQGNIIVDNKLSYEVLILPGQSTNQSQVLNKVSDILGVDIQDLNEKFQHRESPSYLPVILAEDIDIEKAIALEEVKLDSPGIIIQPRPERDYPNLRSASHIIGHLNEIDHWRLAKLSEYGYKTKDMVGYGGVEERYDYYLREEEGGASFEVDHRGRMVRLLGYKPPKKGKDIQLTLDLKLQKIVEAKISGRTGCVIILQPYTGEILAMASFPDFDPAVFRGKRDYSISNLFSDSDAPLLNRAISGVYPPGSIFKLIVASAALDTGKMNLDKTFYCPGSMMIGRKKFKCWNSHGTQNIISGIANSCNVFFYNTGLLLGPQKIYDYALKFGLSNPTYSDLPYEAGGFIPSPLWRRIYKFRKWYDGDTANLSIGQGEVLVTPLQIARVMAVFANGGELVTPYVVKAIDGRDITRYQTKIAKVGLKKNTIDIIRKGLRRVVTDSAGTGNVLSSLPVDVAGKTGTAQAPPGSSHAWFVGYFPFGTPKYVICVFLERGGHGYSSTVLAKQIIERMIEEGLI